MIQKLKYVIAVQKERDGSDYYYVTNRSSSDLRDDLMPGEYDDFGEALDVMYGLRFVHSVMIR